MAHIQKFFDGARVKIKGKPDVWIILNHESIQKGAVTKVTGKIKCRNEKSGEVKFYNEKNCEPV
jgi:hypothetical protein